MKAQNHNINEPTKDFIVHLSLMEYVPFLYFLNRYSLPVQIYHKRVKKTHIECILTRPYHFDPLLIEHMWNQWIEESMDWDYSIQN